MKKKFEFDLWGLFISYKHGGHYIGVYPSLDYTLDVVKEMAIEMLDRSDEDNSQDLDAEVDETMENITSRCTPWKDRDDFYYALNDGTLDTTWFTIQQVSESNCGHILKKAKTILSNKNAKKMLK